jgi:hypothetical protein
MYIPNRFSQHRMKYQAKKCANLCENLWENDSRQFPIDLCIAYQVRATSNKVSFRLHSHCSRNFPPQNMPGNASTDVLYYSVATHILTTASQDQVSIGFSDNKKYSSYRRHPKWQRRVQGANPCADHGRHTARRFDPPSCMMSDRADLQARSLALMRESPVVDPDWNGDWFWEEEWPRTFNPRSPIWKLRQQDIAAWTAYTPRNITELYLKQMPQVDRFPGMLSDSWEAAAINSSRSGTTLNYPGIEWTEMLSVCAHM